MKKKPNESRSRGTVVRVVGNSLAYVSLDEDNETLSFVPNVLSNYRGESFEERQIEQGTTVEVDWKPQSRVVVRASVIAAPTKKHRADGPDEMLNVSATRTSRRVEQLELHPQTDALRETSAFRALPKATRQFGKLVDTAALAPGDLLLTRELLPDRISKLISSVQSEGGYHTDDARWTHAAMYVGDGVNVVEATFNSLIEGGDVRLTSLDEYCQGMHSLRFRRSKFLRAERDGWKVCIRAMSRLKVPYDFLLAARFWFRVVVRGKGFFEDDRRTPISRAVVCSTLYADSYNEATRRSLGEVSGACVPAWLSTSDEFNDIRTQWLRIS